MPLIKKNCNQGYSLFFAMGLCIITTLISLSLFQHYFFTSLTVQNLYHYQSLLSHAESTIERATQELVRLSRAGLLAEADVKICDARLCIIPLQENNAFLLQSISWWEKNRAVVRKVNYAEGLTGFFVIENIGEHYFRITALVKDVKKNGSKAIQVVVSTDAEDNINKESWVER
jgi:Tfp pilus assembly protein PilX